VIFRNSLLVHEKVGSCIFIYLYISKNKSMTIKVKRSLPCGSWFLYITLILSVSYSFSLVAQSTGKEKQAPIPDDIMAVFQTSCMPCHGEKGGHLPTSKLKFTRWNGYGPNRQADKAAQICQEIKKGKMPPKGERTKHPEKIPSKEQIDRICKWAESLKYQKPKKNSL
jgi:hypothetical protein